MTSSVVSGRLARNIKKVKNTLFYPVFITLILQKNEDFVSCHSLEELFESGYFSRGLSKRSSLTGNDLSSSRSRSDTGDSVKSESSMESLSLKKETYIKVHEETLDLLGDEAWLVIDMKVV